MGTILNRRRVMGGKAEINNIITYSASEKLAETTGTSGSALKTDAFNSVILAHVFADGVGTIVFEEDITLIGDYAFNKTNITAITIPSTTKIIGNQAFRGCGKLSYINIPYGVEKISSGAFSSYCGITSLLLPDSVMEIGRGLARDNSTITNIVLSKNLKIIPYLSFWLLQALETITIPANISSIGAQAFGYCIKLSEIICEAVVAPTVDSSTFQNIKTAGTLRVPTGSSGYSAWLNILPSGWTLEEVNF